jgi:hypothetical protein
MEALREKLGPQAHKRIAGNTEVDTVGYFVLPPNLLF